MPNTFHIWVLTNFWGMYLFRPGSTRTSQLLHCLTKALQSSQSLRTILRLQQFVGLFKHVNLYPAFVSIMGVAVPQETEAPDSSLTLKVIKISAKVKVISFSQKVKVKEPSQPRKRKK